MIEFTPNIDPLLNPTLHLWGFEFREPVTSLTDFLTAVVCWVAFFRLRRMQAKGQMFPGFTWYFLLMGIGMTSAAFFGHALQAYVGFNWKMIGWVLTALAILSLEWASADLIRPDIGKIWTTVLKVYAAMHILGLFISIAIPETRDFNNVKINSTIGLVGMILPIHLYAWFKHKYPGSGWILIALLWGGVPALVYNTTFSFCNWFNYHDISHVSMAIYSYILYRGAKRFADAR